MSAVSAAEAVQVLREIVAGRRPLTLSDPSRRWSGIAVGPLEFVAGDARCAFFADHAVLDHLESLQLADGRRARFADWLRADAGNPLDLLEPVELETLEQLLYGAG